MENFIFCAVVVELQGFKHQRQTKIMVKIIMMIIIILAYSNICIKGTYKFSRTAKTYLINFRMKQKQNAFKLHALKYLNAI